MQLHLVASWAGPPATAQWLACQAAAITRTLACLTWRYCAAMLKALKQTWSTHLLTNTEASNGECSPRRPQNHACPLGLTFHWTQVLPCRAKRRRVLSQMEDLQQCYLRLRCQLPQQPGTAEDEPELASAGTAVNGDAQPPSPGRKRMREEETSLAAWGGKAAAEDHAAAAAAAAAAATGSAAPPSGCQQGNPPGQSCASQALPGSSHQERGGQRPVQSGDVAAGGAAISDQGLAEFSRVLSVFTQCSRLKMVAQLPRASSRQSSSILSSIEFDRDSQVGYVAWQQALHTHSADTHSVLMSCPNSRVLSGVGLKGDGHMCCDKHSISRCCSCCAAVLNGITCFPAPV